MRNSFIEMFMSYSAVVVLPAVVVLTGCQNSGSDDSEPKVAKKVILVNGDPNELFRGATTDPASPYTEENALELNDYRLLSYGVWLENVEVATNRDLEKEQAPRDRRSSQEENGQSAQVKFSKIDASHWQLSLLSDSAKIDFLRASDGRLNPYQVDGSEIKPVHWSVSSDKRFCASARNSDFSNSFTSRS